MRCNGFTIRIAWLVEPWVFEIIIFKMTYPFTIVIALVGYICIGLVNGKRINKSISNCFSKYSVSNISGASLDTPCFLEFDQKVSLNLSSEEVKIDDPSFLGKRYRVPSGKSFRLDCSEQRDILRRFEVASLDLKCQRGSLVTAVSLSQDNLVYCC